MYTVIKRNKKFKKRRLVIYDGKKKIAEASPFFGWYSREMFVHPEGNQSILDEIRKCIIDNLYWLLGHECCYDDWEQSVEDWDKGKHVYNVSMDKLKTGMFFNEEEKERAKKSFNNI